MKTAEKIKKYIDFGFQKTDLIAVFAVIICIIVIKAFNIEEIYENSFLENLQLIPLFLGASFCFCAKKYKPLFVTAGLILVLLFFRELSYGRVLYGALPDNPHEFYPLSHYKYGYITNIIIGLYLTFVSIFFFVKKVWKDVFSIIKEVKFPVLTFLFAFIFTILELIGEKADNTVLEEIAELAIYCLTFSICLIYIFKKDKKI